MLAVIIIQALFYNLSKLVGDKAKRLISKRVIQENKARQIFGKTNISHSPDTYTYVYQGGGGGPFWDASFCLIAGERNTKLQLMNWKIRTQNVPKGLWQP